VHGDVEVSDFLNDFSVARLYAGAPMFKTVFFRGPAIPVVGCIR
jgi:hypothetical protein